MTRTEYSQRSKDRKTQEDRAYTNMISEISSYLAKVRNGRSVQAVNPHAPQFSQAADDARLASRGQVPAGYGAPPKPQESFNPNGFGQAFTTPSGASPSYGFTNSYQPSPQAKVFGQAVEALQDERLGMVPGFGGGIRGIGRLRNYFADKEAIRMGGFRPTLREIKTSSPNIEPTGPNQWKGSIGNERAWNDAYIGNVKMGNDAVDALRSSDPMTRTVSNEMYKVLEHSNPSYAEQINQTMIGRQQLEDLNKRAFTQTEGPPPEYIKELFGFKNKK